MSNKRGVYFVASDTVIDMTVAFLNSFRKYNPTILLCLIPFDEHHGRILRLAKEYGFSVYENHHVLAQCDEWSVKFHEARAGQYRKLAAWFGEFNEFVYIDIDTVVMQPVDTIFRYQSSYAVITGHSHIPGSRKFVWKDGICPDCLSSEEFEYSANTGFIMSHIGLFSLEDVAKVVEEGLEIRDSMELMCMEQPLLNLLFIRVLKTYSSMYKINADGDQTIPVECWAGDPRWQLSIDGACLYEGEEKNVLFVHWAGEWAPLGFERFAKTIGMVFGIRLINVRRDMKQRALWNHYRNLRRS